MKKNFRKYRFFQGKLIIDGFIRGDNPDIICHSLKVCEDTPGQPKCRLYPSNSTVSVLERALSLRQRHPSITLQLSKSKLCDFPGIVEICKIIKNVFNNHLPAVDLDHDKFGTEEALRGGSWRGKDCDDVSEKVHPGGHAVEGDATIDHNCNGIVGLDSATGLPWEDEFCNDTKRMGIAVFGDSISAHFHLPEEWLDARNFSEAAFEHLLFILDNEIDWPETSATTGHVNFTWSNIDGQ